jgi:hypothetical protein
MALRQGASGAPLDEIASKVPVPPEIDAATIAIQALHIDPTPLDTSSSQRDAELSYSDSTSSLVPEPSAHESSASESLSCVRASTSLESSQSRGFVKEPVPRERAERNAESSGEAASETEIEGISQKERPLASSRPRLNVSAAKRMILANLGLKPASPDKSRTQHEGIKKEETNG